MAEGGNKDAPYIADIFINHLKVHDPMKRLADIFVFGGASNVQKSGEIIEAVYPFITSLHGMEHFVDIFF